MSKHQGVKSSLTFTCLPGCDTPYLGTLQQPVFCCLGEGFTRGLVLSSDFQYGPCPLPSPALPTQTLGFPNFEGCTVLSQPWCHVVMVSAPLCLSKGSGCALVDVTA